MPTKEDVSRQFGRNARHYAESKGHAQGSDLDIVLELLKPQPDWHVLDVATGAGHTAAMVAPHVASVVATDLAPEMIGETRKLFTARGITNASAEVMDVEALTFADATFDAVTCRIAPHHFIDPQKAVDEIARVLKPGGVFVMEDSYAPQAQRLDRFINDIERRRDPTHVRSYTKKEWRAMLRAAGLRIVKSKNYRKSHNIEEWMTHASLDEDGKLDVRWRFATAPEWARKHFAIEFTGDAPVKYTDDKVIFRCLKG